MRVLFRPQSYLLDITTFKNLVRLLSVKTCIQLLNLLFGYLRNSELSLSFHLLAILYFSFKFLLSFFSVVMSVHIYQFIENFVESSVEFMYSSCYSPKYILFVFSHVLWAGFLLWLLSFLCHPKSNFAFFFLLLAIGVSKYRLY